MLTTLLKPWMRYQEEQTRPKEPWLESVDDYGSRLKGIAQNISKRHNVERNVGKNFEKYSLGSSQPFPGHSQSPPKSSPVPSWAACGSQGAPKSAQERPKSRPRRTQEAPKRPPRAPKSRPGGAGEVPNRYKIEPRGTPDEILARAWCKDPFARLQERFFLVF